MQNYERVIVNFFVLMVNSAMPVNGQFLYDELTIDHSLASQNSLFKNHPVKNSSRIFATPPEEGNFNTLDLLVSCRFNTSVFNLIYQLISIKFMINKSLIQQKSGTRVCFIKFGK